MTSGVHSRIRLLAQGHTDSDIRRAVRSGDLIRLRPGWYATTIADPETVAAVRAGGVLGCVSALRFHDLWIPPGHEGLHVRTSKYGKGRRPGSCQGVGRPLPLDDAVDSIPVALHCAVGCLPADHWVVVCDSALNSRSVTTDELRALLPTATRRIDELLARCDPRSQSGTETLVRLRLRAAGYEVRVQPRIRGVGKVDLRVGRLLIECDSVSHHTGLAQYRNDRRRDRKALVGRWLKLRLTYEEVMFGWEEVFADIMAITRADRHRRRGRHRPREG
ncbi:hypothetical protein OG579_08925 [Williamsia herbipolensis]|uniref:Very-short-patch-repair endonuclease n=1 Tax=Williamsia herbipolensis TaxID=1603258 RepID=A0AAU4K788_9NOCA|nr:hypothetical protein [Williamsia herbipolensis]